MIYLLFVQRQQPENSDKQSFQYRLYGVVVHCGSLEGGHYTACVRMRTVDINTARTFLQEKFLDRQAMMEKEELIKLVNDDQLRERLAHSTSYEHGDGEEDRWFHISDTSVREITDIEELFAKEAYLLFYERLS